MDIPLAKPAMTDEMIHAASEALRNEHLVMGESVYKFEDDFAKYCGTKYAISTSSGTMALQIAIQSAGIEGGSIETSPMSFIATANAIIYAGANPVFIDINSETNNIDPEKMYVDEKTTAFLPVHLHGYPAAMGEICDIASEYPNIVVIEDACQAHGMEYFDKKAGSLGDLGCFSFYTTKNMTVGGDGGMVTTDEKAYAEKAKKLRDCGRFHKYSFTEFGYTARLNTVNAAIGRVQLKSLDKWNEKRRYAAELYDELLKDIENVKRPVLGDAHIKPVHHVYSIMVDNRMHLQKKLKEANIETGQHYPIPIHLQDMYKERGHSRGSYPNAEEFADTCISLPMYPDITEEEINYVCNKVRELY